MADDPNEADVCPRGVGYDVDCERCKSESEDAHLVSGLSFDDVREDYDAVRPWVESGSSAQAILAMLEHRLAIRQRASDASPTSALPRALPQDRDAAVGALRDALEEIAELAPEYNVAGHARLLRLQAIGKIARAALARLAPPQRAPAEPTEAVEALKEIETLMNLVEFNVWHVHADVKEIVRAALAGLLRWRPPSRAT